MCLAIPMQIVEFTGPATAMADLGGAGMEVDISLVEGVKKGDYVIVHAGFAIELLNSEEARKQLEFFAEMAAGPEGEA